MQVNLLPLKPTTTRYKWPIALFAAIVMLSFSLLVGWQYNVIDNKVKESASRLEQLKSQQSNLITQEEQLSPYADSIAGFLLEAEALENNRVPWVAVLDKISGYLPQSGYLLEINSNENNTFEISGEVSSADDLAAFLQNLNKDTLFSEIALNEMIKKEASNYEFSMSVLFNPSEIQISTQQ